MAQSIKMDIKPVFIAVSSLFILCCKNNSGKLSRGSRPFILKISTANYGFLWFWYWWWSRYKLMLRWWELGPGVTLGDVIRWTGNIPGPGWGCDMVITSGAAGDMVITSCVGHHTVYWLCTPVTSNIGCCARIINICSFNSILVSRVVLAVNAS